MLQFEIEQRPIQGKQSKKPAIDPKVLEQFREVVKGTDKGVETVLKFTDSKTMGMARSAILEVGPQEKIWLRVRKERGSEANLVLRRVTKAEFDEAQKKAAARGEKLRGPRGPRKT